MPPATQASPVTVPLFLRRYELTVQIPGTTYTIISDDMGANALRFTFDIQQKAFQNIFWFADIVIYNLAADTSNDILSTPNYQDIQVSVKAGYKSLPRSE